MVKLFFLFSIQHSVRVSRKKLWKIGFSLPLCFPLEYRTIYWNFTRAKNFIEIFPLRSNKREATSILSSLQLEQHGKSMGVQIGRVAVMPESKIHTTTM